MANQSTGPRGTAAANTRDATGGSDALALPDRRDFLREAARGALTVATLLATPTALPADDNPKAAPATVTRKKDGSVEITGVTLYGRDGNEFKPGIAVDEASRMSRKTIAEVVAALRRAGVVDFSYGRARPFNLRAGQEGEANLLPILQGIDVHIVRKADQKTAMIILPKP